MSTEPHRSLRYVDDITRDDVLALEAFIYSQLQPVQDAAGETGDTFCALRYLDILVCDSAGLLLASASAFSDTAKYSSATVRSAIRA
ncbi:hypothetical protein ACPC39_31530 [Streptomyces cellulosae]